MIRLPFLSAVAAALVAVSAPAAEPPAPGALTRPPAVAEAAEPEYPAEAQAAGLAGEVLLELEISEAGVVTDAVVSTPAGHGFDESAVAAVRRIRFIPAEIDGKPAPVRIEYRVKFELKAPAPAPSPPLVNLRGQVLQRGTRLPVSGALVEAGGQTIYTDRDGRFELAGVPLGAVKVRVVEPSHQRWEVEETIAPGQATEVKYWLQKVLDGAYEAVVVGERDKREVSRVALSTGEIARVPGASGDAVKVIQNLPGVARAPGGFGLLVVRGGNPRDTRVYVDGLEVPQVFHFGGLTSVYSSDLLDKVEFEPGNFGVQSGRATAGRVNLVTRDPGQRTHAVFDANLYHSTALVETRPREDLGAAVAVRRSYADAFIGALSKGDEDSPNYAVAPRYYDFQAKVAWTPSTSDKVRLDAFGSNDKTVLTGIKTDGLQNIDEFSYSTAFYQLAATWDRRFDEATRVHLLVGQGWLDMNAKVDTHFSERERISTTTMRAELYRDLGQRLTLGAGFDGLYRPRFDVDVVAPETSRAGRVQLEHDLAPSQRFSLSLSETQMAGWLEATFRPLERLTVVPGIRYDNFGSISKLSWVDPRLSARLALGEATALKAAAGLYHQAPAYAYLTEQWGNPHLKPEGAWQYSVGVERRLLGRVFLDAQLYYKRLFDLALPTDTLVSRNGQMVPEHYSSAGTGKAYGGELLVRWNPDGRFFGWVSYSLSRSTRDQQVAGGRIEGQPEGQEFDQPHNVVAVGTWELPEIWRGLSAGFRLRYTTGAPYEQVRSAVYDSDSDAYQAIKTGQVNSRLPDFFQLDVRVDHKWTYRTWTLATYLEVQNVTNRSNAESIAYSFDYTKSGVVSGLPFFPAFGLRAEY